MPNSRAVMFRFCWAGRFMKHLKEELSTYNSGLIEPRSFLSHSGLWEEIWKSLLTW